MMGLDVMCCDGLDFFLACCPGLCGLPEISPDKSYDEKA